MVKPLFSYALSAEDVKPLCVLAQWSGPVLCRTDGLNILHPCGICKHPRIFPRTLKKYLTYHFITPNFRQLNCIQLKTSET